VKGFWFFVFGALWTAGCSSGKSSIPPPHSVRPDQVIQQFSMDSYQNMSRVWTLSAPRAEIFEADHRVELMEPRLRFFHDKQPGSKVSAALGRLDTATRDLWAGGGVVMVSTEGTRLESDWMRYDSLHDQLTSTASVVITRSASVVRGVGWKAKPDLSVVEIDQQRGVLVREGTRKTRRP
jgi:LPS export ABC transporter protein LptC